MSVAVVSRGFMAAALYSILNTSGGFKIRLFTNSVSLDRDTALGAFTEATYDTYPTGGILVSGLPTLNAVNEVKTTTVIANFPAPAASGPVLIYGWHTFIGPLGVLGTDWLVAALFPGGPITLTNGGASLPIVVDLFALDLNSP